MSKIPLKITSYIQKIKRKPLVITIAMLSTFVIGVASFTDAIERIYLLIHPYLQLNSTYVSGYWVIGETKKTPLSYIKLKTLDGKIVGSTTVFFDHFTWLSYRMPITAPIYDAKLTRKRITFTTKRIYFVPVQHVRDYSMKGTIPQPIRQLQIVHYQGEIRDNSIKFDIYADGGGYYDAVIAKRIGVESAKSLIKTTYKKKYRIDIEDIP